MDKVLVIGGAGFVGSHLIEQLVAQGKQVVSLDNYLSGSINNHIGGCSYVTGPSFQINEIFDAGERFDVVFHLGEYSRVEASFDDIDLVFENNHKGLYEVLKFCKNTESKLIYSGSSTKFGDNGLSGSASPYAWTKRSNTDLVLAYSKWFPIDFAITYFYNAYGGREVSEGNFSTVVAKFLHLKRNGAETLPVVAPGTQLRNFTHINDIVSGLVAVAARGSGDGYGIGSDDAISILELVNYFQCEPTMIPERAGNRLNSQLMTEKTKEIGWTPEYSIKTYIDEALRDLSH